MIDLCARLGIQSVAEGIEDVETLNLLRDMGCDLAQGFLLGRPVPADQLSAMLRERPA
jgi:EAL domain-containing protein (putative c-di-GMP-specific phosphodiesterase class I)